MQGVRTVCVKLLPTADQRQVLNDTMRKFAAACNVIAKLSQGIRGRNKAAVQAKVYPVIREQFGLSSNLTIRAIARVCESTKGVKFSPTSVNYDQRILSVRRSDWTFSLTTTEGRIRVASELGDYQKNKLLGSEIKSATLVKRGGSFFLHINTKIQIPVVFETVDVLGVDLGVINLATDSDGRLYSGANVESVRVRYQQQRKALQQRGTKGAKKKLKRLSGREANFKRHTNHVISRTLVTEAKRTERAISLEDLKGITTRVTAKSKLGRNRIASWSFNQLRYFIEYKAAQAGVPVIKISPKNTSITCSVCGHCDAGNRLSRDAFVCLSCGHQSHADENAARNIRAMGICNLPKQLAEATLAGKPSRAGYLLPPAPPHSEQIHTFLDQHFPETKRPAPEAL